ncbi:MAG: hypothetical protein R3E39_00390 [Anaerolineae bacterium]
MEVVGAPPVAFLIYIVLVGCALGLGRLLAGPSHPNPTKSGVYAGGEKAPRGILIPGYHPFFLVTVFFAILHLGALVLASGSQSPFTAVYVLGLLFALIALTLG